LGMILIAPLLISWSTWRRTIASPPTLPRLVEGAAILLFTLATILCIFRILPTDIPIINRPYALFLLVIWMAIRFEAPGASCLSLLISLSPVLGREVHMTVSIGLAQYKTKEEIKAFVHRVDQWMYQGKKNGKDRVCCES